MTAGTPKPLLIFDFDGTLANTIEVGIRTYNELASGYDLRSITVEDARERRKLNTLAPLDEFGISWLLSVKLGAHISNALHDRMHEVEIIKGNQEALQELHREGFCLGIFSSNTARVFFLYRDPRHGGPPAKLMSAASQSAGARTAARPWKPRVLISASMARPR
jgi:beta-phosphoglucomutase-like phosphatase (HAD superfamily)